jgi:aspartate aminotransferase-like enzyme
MMPEPLLLMTPGPTRVPQRVLDAGARPMIHHRSPEFSRELATLIELLAPVFGTRRPVLPVHTTGRGALEATICNLFSPGDEIVVCCNGKFGEMWAGFAESYGVHVHRVATDWTRDIDAAELEACLAEHPRARAVAVPYTDSSTGVTNNIAGIALIAAAHGALMLVDGIPSIGGLPFAFDDWGFDVAVTASQKCLMSSPGISFVVVSERAREAIKRARLPRNYWDFTAIERAITAAKPETPGTAPVHLILQVAEALRLMHEEGLGAVFRRHALLAERVRDGIREMGLDVQCPAVEQHSATMTAVALPAVFGPAPVRDGLKRHSILTAAGLGRFQPAGFRIGHMGDIRLADVERTLTALRSVLVSLRTNASAAVLA